MKKLWLLVPMLMLFATAASALPACNVACGDTIYSSCEMQSDLDCSGGSPNFWFIRAMGQGITVDGNGYKVIGNGSSDGKAAISIDNNDITVEGFEISDVSYGIRPIQADNVIVKNNTVHGAIRGVYIDDSDGIEIAENDLYDNSDGVKFDGSSTDGFVHNNSVHENDFGVLIENDDIDTNHIIQRNDIFNNTYHGVRVLSGKTLTVDHNWIFGHHRGVVVESSNVFVYANHLQDNDNAGIYFETASQNNTMFLNFINNTAVHSITNYGDNSIVSTNYYTEYNEPSEGCVNNNGDPFCDSPFEKNNVTSYGTFSDGSTVVDTEFILAAIGPTGGGGKSS